MTKQYKLLKDLPNVTAGTTLFWKGGQYSCMDKNNFTASFNKALVETNSDWFELTRPETIEVVKIETWGKTWKEDDCYLVVITSSPVPEEKYPLIKEKLEKILNQ